MPRPCCGCWRGSARRAGTWCSRLEPRFHLLGAASPGSSHHHGASNAPAPPLALCPPQKEGSEKPVSDQWLDPFVIVGEDDKPVATIEDGEQRRKQGVAAGGSTRGGCVAHGFGGGCINCRACPCLPSHPSHPHHTFPCLALHAPPPPFSLFLPFFLSFLSADDAVVIFNFRADRVIELSKASAPPGFIACVCICAERMAERPGPLRGWPVYAHVAAQHCCPAPYPTAAILPPRRPWSILSSRPLTACASPRRGSWA